MTGTQNNMGWTICRVLAVVIMITAFTPLFLPAGQAQPSLLGMPYALWSGIALCIVMVALTAVATIVHPGGKKNPR